MSRRVTCLTAIAGLALASATVANAQDVDEDDTITFAAVLTGAQEVTPPDAPTTPSPGVLTDMVGTIIVNFDPGLSEMRFTLAVQNGRAITMAHLHCGRAGQNGPVVVTLFPPNEQGVDVNGTLAEGVASNAEVEAGAAPCEGLVGRPVNNIASIAQAAAEGRIYANVHTVQNPAGEVRGQLILR